jgi:signal transduction histidine kinase
MTPPGDGRNDWRVHFTTLNNCELARTPTMEEGVPVTLTADQLEKGVPVMSGLGPRLRSIRVGYSEGPMEACAKRSGDILEQIPPDATPISGLTPVLEELNGVLYLENGQTTLAFTPAGIAVLKLLESQAAISLENARLHAELIRENRERRKAEEALRESEASLAETQRISRTGSWRWNVRTGAVQASRECLRIFAADRLSFAQYLESVHPEDRPVVEHALSEAVRERSRFAYENRIILPDSSIRHVQSAGYPELDETGEIEFIATVMDVSERKHADETLRRTQLEVAHASRLATMGELAGSIIHEVNQPLAAVVTNADACLRWLNRDPPGLTQARSSIARLTQDVGRAVNVVKGLRALAKKSGPELTNIDIGDAIREVLAILRSELSRSAVVVEVHLGALGTPVLGDRVQIQQVLLNLIRNGTEAMSAVTGRPRALRICGQVDEANEARITVEDNGTGLDAEIAGRVFEPLFTTKVDGMGMGLSICRSIVEAHGGRLWATPRLPHGAAFTFTVPLALD